MQIFTAFFIIWIQPLSFIYFFEWFPANHLLNNIFKKSIFWWVIFIFRSLSISMKRTRAVITNRWWLIAGLTKIIWWFTSSLNFYNLLILLSWTVISLHWFFVMIIDNLLNLLLLIVQTFTFLIICQTHKQLLFFVFFQDINDFLLIDLLNIIDNLLENLRFVV